MNYAIKADFITGPTVYYVKGYDEQRRVPELTDDLSRARPFASKEDAVIWVLDHEDGWVQAGGIPKGKWSVIPIQQSS